MNYNLDFKINGEPIKLSESVKYLGVTLDYQLNWNINTKDLCSKLKKANGAISRLRQYIPRTTLIQIYYALFFSHMNYACQIWGQINNTNVDRVFKLQKRCLRLITFSDFHAPSSELFSILNVLKIYDVIKLQNISLVHDILKNNCPPRVSSIFNLSYYQHDYETRGSYTSLLSRPRCRTLLYGINSITYQSILQWNEFQQKYFESPLIIFSHTKLKSSFYVLIMSQY